MASLLPGSATRRTRATVVPVLALALLSGTATEAAAAPAARPDAAPVAGAAGSSTAASSWLVSADPVSLPGLIPDLRAAGARITRSLPGVGSLQVEATGDLAARLAGDARISAVSPDSAVRLLAGSYDAKGDANSTYNISQVTGARAMWAAGGGRLRWTGAGVDVAVLDSGVSPVAGLDAPGKVVQGPDLSFDSQSPTTRQLDGFGHGTHMAGIIAGKDADANPAETGQAGPFMGMAPDARIVSVKVADAYGNADVSQILAGIDWVVENRQKHGLNVRVLNLSLGTPSTQAALLDPLSHAVEQAWRKGIVVVVSAGNDGTGTGRLLNPARNPYVLAVGANDSRGTNSTIDDVIPDFSSRGDGIRNPDLVAPGRSVVSLRVPGSYIDEQYGKTAAVGERFLRGSGTSQAAAVVSGAVALLLQQHPEYTPEDVKHLLTTGTRALPAADVQAQGAGMLDLRRPAAAGALSYQSQAFPQAKGTGSLHAARGGLLVETALGTPLTGEKDIFGKAFAGSKHALLLGSGKTWTLGSWNGSAWTGTAWAADGWQATAWTGVDWTGRAWAGRAWAGGTWNGRAWADGYWSGRAWAGRAWAGRAWATGAWD